MNEVEYLKLLANRASCARELEADELLSPAASTLAGAVFESWWKLRRLEKRGELTRQREGVLPPWHPLFPGGPKLVKHRRLDRCGHEDCEVCKSDSKWVRADEV